LLYQLSYGTIIISDCGAKVGQIYIASK